jgi:cephalosporin-C deacetylase-like acetyl esterase
MAPDQATGVSQGYNAIGNTSRETSYFLNMYLRDSRAIDYIASRPEWDGKTLVILGTSMGGQQSLAAAGLNPRVTAVLVNEPAGADGNGELHGRKAGYPNWPADNPEAMKTAPYFDTVNFATRIHAPVLAAIGYIDVVCPPVGIWTAVDQIPGAKEVIPMVESNHNNLTPQKQGAWDARSKEVLGILLSGEPFVPAGWQ